MSEDITDYISASAAQTLYGLFRERLNKTPDSTAYLNYCEKTQQWQTISWSNAAQQIAYWQQALKSEGLLPGDRVALNLKNCPEWVFFDQAALSLGLITVPLYPDDRPDSLAFILQDADVKFLLLQNHHQWNRLKPSLSDEHQLKRVIIKSTDKLTLDAPAMYLDEWLKKDISYPLLDWQTETDQLATIIYTSGTTGKPKGVMLSHYNILSVASASLEHFKIKSNDLFLSFLPLSHTLERTAGYYLPMMTGSKVAFSRGIPQLANDLQQLKPSALIAVPRIFERIYQRVRSNVSSQPWYKRFLFLLTHKIGWCYFLHKQQRRQWSPSFLLMPVLDKLVAKNIQALFGGQLRVAVSGGAAIPHHVAEFFIGMGVNLLQGYGLTETSPVISVNTLSDNKPYSVGQPIPTVKVKIAENSELLVNSPGNMLGYWNNHKATAKTIDAEGWLHTGDQAEIADTGHIFITGRIKDILVLSNGEKVSPADMEMAITSDELFEQALVVGEGKPFLSALIVLNAEQWLLLAQKLKLDAMDKNSLQNKPLQQHVIQQFRRLLHEFPAYAKIRRVNLSLSPWTVENGMLTPTLKIKRSKLIEENQHIIAEFYQD
ncbi:AMP-dependent synthetase/ligase [Methylophaga sulfidovorans]|uniref:Long-chain acyl-CoA synthetase n=1 Tax=Methylophaga sulfidovorans TaxID=45496 RepID=A0A1I3VNH2_9GAMM|nr:long-chain fatty acid--CoA ligase [Methylophaga sulfidovorans]SFJ96938.1 long-chain acyl-CoA synthetase [Methylophaga sulfidovorans]